MLKVIDVLDMGNRLSVTFEGKCEQIKNGSLIKDSYGNTFEILSVAMMSFDNPEDITKSTTVLLTPGKIEKGSVLRIA